MPSLLRLTTTRSTHLSGVAASLGSTSEGGSCHAHSGSSAVSVCCSSGEMLEGSLPLPSLPLPLSSRKSTLGSIDVGDGGAGGDFLAISLRLSVSRLCRLCTESLMPAGASLRSPPFVCGTCRTPSWAGATASALLPFEPLLRFLNRPKPGTILLSVLRSFQYWQTPKSRPKYQVICRDPASCELPHTFTWYMSLLSRKYDVLYVPTH